MDNIEDTKKELERIIRKWYEAATVMNLETFMELASDNFVLHNPGRAINGKREFEAFFHDYGKKSYGPVNLGEFHIEVSKKGDMAYLYGTHIHSIMNGKVVSKKETWKQLVVFNKEDEKWKICAMSETNL